HGGDGPGRLPLDGVRERLRQADAVRRQPPGRGAGGVGRGGGAGGGRGGGDGGRGRFGRGRPREFAEVLPQAAPRRQGHPRHPDGGAERPGGGRSVGARRRRHHADHGGRHGEPDARARDQRGGPQHAGGAGDGSEGGRQAGV